MVRETPAIRLLQTVMFAGVLGRIPGPRIAMRGLSHLEYI